MWLQIKNCENSLSYRFIFIGYYLATCTKYSYEIQFCLFKYDSSCYVLYNQAGKNQSYHFYMRFLYYGNVYSFPHILQLIHSFASSFWYKIETEYTCKYTHDSKKAIRHSGSHRNHCNWKNFDHCENQNSHDSNSYS